MCVMNFQSKSSIYRHRYFIRRTSDKYAFCMRSPSISEPFPKIKLTPQNKTKKTLKSKKKIPGYLSYFMQKQSFKNTGMQMRNLKRNVQFV